MITRRRTLGELEETRTELTAETDQESGLRRWISSSSTQIGSVVAGVIAWHLLSLFYPPYLFPGPLDLTGYFAQIFYSGELLASVQMTLYHLGVTTLVVIPTAIFAGFLMGRRPVFEALGRPWVPFWQTIPDLIVIAFALIVFGLGSKGVVFVGFMISTPFMVVNVWKGVKNVDQELLQMARAFHATDWEMLREIVIPDVLPYFLSGSRVAVGIAWHVIVFAEYLMTNAGVGARIKGAVNSYDNVGVFAWGIVVVMMMLLIEYGIFKPVERSILRRLGRPEGRMGLVSQKTLRQGVS
ncbi:MAG: ABC transporter permease [Anaerolineae bacterium]